MPQRVVQIPRVHLEFKGIRPQTTGEARHKVRLRRYGDSRPSLTPDLARGCAGAIQPVLFARCESPTDRGNESHLLVRHPSRSRRDTHGLRGAPPVPLLFLSRFPCIPFVRPSSALEIPQIGSEEMPPPRIDRKPIQGFGSSFTVIRSKDSICHHFSASGENNCIFSDRRFTGIFHPSSTIDTSGRTYVGALAGGAPCSML